MTVPADNRTANTTGELRPHPQREVEHIFGDRWAPSVLSLIYDFDRGQCYGGF